MPHDTLHIDIANLQLNNTQQACTSKLYRDTGDTGDTGDAGATRDTVLNLSSASNGFDRRP